MDGGESFGEALIDRAEVAAMIAEGIDPMVQFAAPDYSPQQLAQINALCEEFGAAFQVRFYGHYGSHFDAAVLEHLPAVRSLAVDCRIENASALGRLTQLQELSFGSTDFDQPDFLATLDLSGMERLYLNETKKNNFDLAPLQAAKNLQFLYLEGHHRNIASLSNLPVLASLVLRSIGKKQGLDWIEAMPALRQLELVLGGREHIDDLSHRHLQLLQVIWVKGLASLGDLSRFPALTALRVEDLAQLRRLDLSSARLQRLSLTNCRQLSELAGLDLQTGLEELFVSQTPLPLDELRDRLWPESMRVLGLYSGSSKWNETAHASAGAKGFAIHSSRWP